MKTISPSPADCRHESGNVFFYIFIGVALFAGLTMALSQSGRVTSSSLAEEQTRLRATELIDYADVVSKAVGSMRLRGTRVEDLRFSHPELAIADYGDPATGDPQNHVFNNNGGGVVYRRPDRGATATQEDFSFVSQNELIGFGTSCADAPCADILMVLRNVQPSVCDAINKLAKMDLPADTVPETASFNDSEKFSGSFGATVTTIGDDSDSHALAHRPFGCFLNDDNNTRYFYRVLWAR